MNASHFIQPPFPSAHTAPSTHLLLQWAVRALNTTATIINPTIRPAPQFSLPNNLTSAAGNTYKNIYEATSMHSGLILVLLVNVVTTALAILFYRYVILRETGLLSPEEVRLLRKYPKLRPSNSYTPSESLVRGAPPMRWTGWHDFFTSTESSLSRDAQVYLLFQRACIFTTAVCALVASLFLMPSYWFGGAVFHTSPNAAPPRTLLSLLGSDRGIFERFTSHNLSPHSPLVMLQLPVFVVVALCVVVMYSIITTAAGEERSVDEWLATGPSSSSAAILPSPLVDPPLEPRHPAMRPHSPSPPPSRQWTVFARGLPRHITSADHLYDMLDALFPTQVARVELVCKGKVSEARLLRTLSTARHRLEYLYHTADDPDERMPILPTQTLLGRIFSMFTRRRTRAEMIHDLESKIESLQKDFESRKAEPVCDFLGCAFLTFRTPMAAASVLKEFPIRTRRRSVSADIRDVEGGNETRLSTERLSRSTLRLSRGMSTSSSDWALPFRNLYRGTANLLPDSVREKLQIPSPSLRSMTSASMDLERVDCDPMERRRALAMSHLRNMKAERAPKSGDIIWRNIGISFLERTVREMVVQILVFAFLILFTSPVTMLTALKLVFSELALLTDPQMIFGSASGGQNTTSTSSVLSAFNSMNETDGLAFLTNLSADNGAAVDSLSNWLMNLLPPFLTSNTYLTTAILAYLPVLLLAFVFAIVPSLLRLTCAMEGYPTRSALEMSVFRKTSFYYVMNAVVLPSLALNTASEFLQMVYKQSGGGANVYNALPILQRLFSGDIAYFLCCYLVQLALTGSVFWLMRIPSSLSMMVRRRMALTPLEVAEAKCADIFDYPRHYAYNVTVMSMVLLFGFMAPLIWYFALFYFLCKHVVDVYTLRYVHPRTHIDGRLPRLSSNFILIWTIVSQLSLAVIFYLQGWVRAGIATALLCALTLAGCLSVSSTMGNRMLRVVALLRDAAIERVLRMAGSRYLWVDADGLANVSSTSSSSQSLTESHESDALLRGATVQRRISVEVDAEQLAEWRSHESIIEATSTSRALTSPSDTVIGDCGREQPFLSRMSSTGGSGRIGSGRGSWSFVAADPTVAGEFDGRGYDSDLEDEGGNDLASADIENGLSRPIAHYGTCGVMVNGDDVAKSRRT